MADIFLSCERVDQQRVAPIVGLLRSQGWSVQWHPDAGEMPAAASARELDAASCVVVAWSIDSIASSRVQAEASEGLDRGILVAVHLDISDPPSEFRAIPPVQLAGWIGDASSPRAQQLIASVSRQLGPTDLEGVPDRGLASAADAREDAGASHEDVDHFELPRALAIDKAPPEAWERIAPARPFGRSLVARPHRQRRRRGPRHIVAERLGRRTARQHHGNRR